MSATSVCGSDLWPYRGIEAVDGPAPMGHEYVGIVEEVGSEVTTIKLGQFVVGSFFASDNTCGATDIVTERGDDGVAKITELTGGIGAHSDERRAIKTLLLL